MSAYKAADLNDNFVVVNILCIGVLDMSFQLSEQPRYGVWKVRVKAFVSLKFIMTEYASSNSNIWISISLSCTIVLFNTFESSRNHTQEIYFAVFATLNNGNCQLLILRAELTCLCLTVNMSGFLNKLFVPLKLILLLIFRVLYMRRLLKFMNFVSSLLVLKIKRVKL